MQPDRSTSVRRASSPVAGACLLLMLCFASQPRAAVFTVGGDASCTHASLQSAIDAAHAAPGADRIHLARSLTYVAQALVIDTAQELLIDGGFAHCDQLLPDTAQTQLSGAGGSESEVLRIRIGTGGLVQLQRLRITDGDNNGSEAGGGIAFTGDGILAIANSTISNNIAGIGGGIYARGTGTNTELVLGENVLISSNTARYNGGGLFVQGLEMTMSAPGSLIAFNEATGSIVSGQLIGGFGGGIHFNADDLSTYAMLGSSGGGSLGSIYGNTAQHGGGIAMNSSDENDDRNVLVTMFSTDPDALNGLVGNFAYQRGGAIYAQPYAFMDGATDAMLVGWSIRIADNAAPAGAAAFLDSDSTIFTVNGQRGGGVSMNLGASGPPPGAVPCNSGVFCGEVVGNIASDENANRTDGAVFQGTDDGGNVFLTRVHVHDNHGGRLIDSGDSSYVEGVILRSTLVEGNSTTHELIRAEDSLTEILDSTLAGNTIGGAQVLRLDSLRIGGSILWQPGTTSLSQREGTLEVGNMIASEVASLGDGPEAVAATPRFVDPERGDFGLRAASHAVDVLPAVPGTDNDMAGRPRDVDLPIKPDIGGPRDLGALERQAVQPLVLNGNFDADARHWTLLHAGASLTAGENAAGPPGSHALHIQAAETPRAVAAVQCLHLPGPGRYALNGFGRGTSAGVLHRDSLLLAWELRYDGDEACDAGAPDASGEHFLTSGTAWNRPLDPATIDVPVALWTHETSLLITPVIVDQGNTVLGGVNGYFDGITLEVASIGPMVFSDSFEGSP